MLATSRRPLAVRLAPSGALWQAILVVGGSLLIALAAQLAIPLPFSPVPVTGQTFAVLLVGATLGSRLGFMGTAAYVAEGLAGMPVFAGGRSAWSPSSVAGVPVIIGPTAGYIAGFALAALAVGALAERGWDRRLLTAAAAMLVGEVAIYGLGLPWLARYVGVERVLELGLSPFIAGDLYKLIAAATLLPIAWRLVRT